jgi:hypothetical protein
MKMVLKSMVFAAALLIIGGPVLVAQDGDVKSVQVTATTVAGIVEAQSPGSEEWVEIEVGAVLDEGVKISTGFDGEIQLQFEGGTLMNIEPLTTITISKNLIKETGDKDTLQMEVDIDFGEIQLDVKKENLEADAKISAPNSTTAIRGTILSIRVDPEARQQMGQGGAGGGSGVSYGRIQTGVEVTVDEGTVEVTSEDSGETIPVTQGEKTSDDAIRPTTMIRLNEMESMTPMVGTTDAELGITGDGGDGEVGDINEDVVSNTTGETLPGDTTNPETNPTLDGIQEQEAQIPLPGPPPPPSN